MMQISMDRKCVLPITQQSRAWDSGSLTWGAMGTYYITEGTSLLETLGSGLFDIRQSP